MSLRTSRMHAIPTACSSKHYNIVESHVTIWIKVDSTFNSPSLVDLSSFFQCNQSVSPLKLDISYLFMGYQILRCLHFNSYRALNHRDFLMQSKRLHDHIISVTALPAWVRLCIKSHAIQSTFASWMNSYQGSKSSSV